MPVYKIIFCDLLNPVDDKRCEKVRKGAIVLKKSRIGLGEDYKVDEYGPEQRVMDSYADKKNVFLIDKRGELCLPGFIDTHFHWVQDEVCLMAKDSLLDWLSQKTWPYEAKFKDKEFAKKKAKSFSNELLRMGTLGGAVYGSVHGHTVDYALKYFKGDYIAGNVLMTRNSPEYLLQSVGSAKKSIQRLSKKYQNNYAMTPRFAPTTCPEVMSFGAKLAKKYGSFIQSHLSETENEVEYVLSLFKKIKGFEKVKSYTEIYDKCGILGPRTIMGHGIYLSKDELSRLAKTKTSLAHCPSSNAPIEEMGLGSGLFDFKKIERAKIHWSLASDIGGGPFLSMFDVMRSFVSQNSKANRKGATYTKAFYRATLAGAMTLKKNKEIGNLDKGKWANLVFVSSPKIKRGEKGEDILKTLCETSSFSFRKKYQDLILSTWLRGQEVFKREKFK